MAVQFYADGWMTSVNGNATARGHTVDIDENFFEIVEKSDLLMALMAISRPERAHLHCSPTLCGRI